MTEEVLTMSREELNRLEVIQRGVSKRLRQEEAVCCQSLSDKNSDLFSDVLV